MSGWTSLAFASESELQIAQIQTENGNVLLLYLYWKAFKNMLKFKREFLFAQLKKALPLVELCALHSNMDNYQGWLFHPS